MKFVFDGVQQMFVNIVVEFIGKYDGIVCLCFLCDVNDLFVYDLLVWVEMVDFGWMVIFFVEVDGGFGMGFVEVVLIIEVLGKGLVFELYIFVVVFVGSFLNGVSDIQCEVWIGVMIDGLKCFVVVYQEEGVCYDFLYVIMFVSVVGDGWVFNGEKIQVIDGYEVDGWIVLVCMGGDVCDVDGIMFFFVFVGCVGVFCSWQKCIDLCNVGLLKFDGVQVMVVDIFGEVGNG